MYVHITCNKLIYVYESGSTIYFGVHFRFSDIIILQWIR